jgi:hypothetical protein
MNSVAGFLGHLGGPAIDMQVVLIFVAAGFIGALAGARLAKHTRPDLLRKGFAVFVIVLAVFLLADNAHKVGWI